MPFLWYWFHKIIALQFFQQMGASDLEAIKVIIENMPH